MRLFAFFLVYLAVNVSLFVTAFQGGGSDAGNGGGLVEKNLIYAYENLGPFIKICLHSQRCGINAKERHLLSQIMSSLSFEYKNSLQFTNETSKPGFFHIDGLPRIAKTGNSVGDPIYINQDLLYPKTQSGQLQWIDIATAAAILIHELGHHHGVKDHIWLDQLGTHLAQLLYVHSLKAEFWNGNAILHTFQLNSVKSDTDKKHLLEFDQLLLENNSELYTLTPQILARLQCPNPLQKPRGLRLYNVHEKRGVSFDAKTQILKKPINAWFILSCELGQESDHGDLDISLSFLKREDGRFDYMPDAFIANMKSCLQFKDACK